MTMTSYQHYKALGTEWLSNLNVLCWPLLHRWWISLPLLVLVYCAFLATYRLTLHPLAKFPGPKLWATTRLPWHVALHKGVIHHRFLELHLQYGPIVRIAPGELSIIHADAWRDIYSNKNFEKNSLWFKPSRLASDATAITSYKEEEHARLRRAFMGALSDSSVLEMSGTIESYVELLIKRLGEHVQQGGGECIVDLVSWLNFTTFDIVGHFAFGEPFNCLADGKAHPWVALNLAFGRGVALSTSLAFLSPLDRLFEFIIPKDIRAKFAYHQTLTREKVTARLAMEGERGDFIGSALRHNRKMSEKGDESKMVKRNEMDQNMGIFIFAGSETSASTLASAFRYTLQRKDVLQRLNEEVSGAFATEEQIKARDCTKLEYVTAVLNEAMRLGPPSTIGVPRRACVGTYACGYWIPKGTLISLNQFAAYRSPSNFADPNGFCPERFIPSSNASAGDRMEAFQPFGQGRHQCIGYRMAWSVISLTLTRLLFAFDMELVDRQIKDYGAQEATLFWEKEPLMVRLRRHIEPNTYLE